MAAEPRFSVLPARQSRALLRRQHVGRIAYTFRDRVDIEPISYVAQGEWIYGRTAPGTKVARLRHHRWVAFQVDDVRGPYDWESTVVHGAVYFLTDGDTPTSELRRAMRLLRSIDPRALTDEDLTPERTVLFRIHVDSITGRRAASRRRR